MNSKIRILCLSANPWTTSRILVDEEAREIFERLQEGPFRDRFQLYKHEAIRAVDLQRLLMMYEPHIVHFSGHGSKTQRLILGGTPGRGKEIDRQGLVEVLTLYKEHLRLVLLNACFTDAQARSLSEVIDYAIGTGKGMRDRVGVAFAGAFYRALGFGRSAKDAFYSARAELGLMKRPLTKGIELFVRSGLNQDDAFPGFKRREDCDRVEAPPIFFTAKSREHSREAKQDSNSRTTDMGTSDLISSSRHIRLVTTRTINALFKYGLRDERSVCCVSPGYELTREESKDFDRLSPIRHDRGALIAKGEAEDS